MATLRVVRSLLLVPALALDSARMPGLRQRDAGAIVAEHVVLAPDARLNVAPSPLVLQKHKQGDPEGCDHDGCHESNSRTQMACALDVLIHTFSISSRRKRAVLRKGLPPIVNTMPAPGLAPQEQVPRTPGVLSCDGSCGWPGGRKNRMARPSRATLASRSPATSPQPVTA